MIRCLRYAMTVAILFATITSVGAQPPAPPESGIPDLNDPFNVLNSLGGPPGGLAGARVEFTGTYRMETGARTGRLSIRAVIQPGWHMYSTTQPGGGPRPTEFNVPPSPQFEVTGDFQADRDPAAHDDPAFPGVPVEEYSDEVTWTAPLRIMENVDPETVKITVRVGGQVCEVGGSCELIEDEPVEVKFAGYYEPPSASGRYADPGGHVTILGHLEPKVAVPGSTVNLVLTASLQPSWHVYRYAATDPNKISKPTLITLQKTSGWRAGEPDASLEPVAEDTGLDDEPIIYYHEGTVSWTVPLEVPEDAEVGEHEIVGAIAYQTCTPTTCDLPTGARFQVTVTIGAASVKGSVPMAFSAVKYDQVAKLARARAASAAAVPPAAQRVAARPGTWSDKSILTILGLAFLAGLILNVMPCVLPVIGLKIMSFVQQAGGSRWEILSLNLWFSFGLMTVFWILAGAAAFAHHGWGAHFESVAFTVVMIGIVFSFALSFLGVWEVPIPGFVGGQTMQGVAEKEGVAGAYSKGILSTILATPCAGPLLVPAVSWSVAQPPGLTFLAFTSIGLGMATPYLLIGAFPKLINALPKPGAWMDTFKQLMGFLLLGTVIWLFSSLQAKWIVPTLTLLLGLGVACWWIGRTPLTAELGTRLAAWANATAIIVASALLGFMLLVPRHQLAWEPYSRVSLDEHLKAGRVVLVDFTADW